jgi:hypothetical protein
MYLDMPVERQSNYIPLNRHTFRNAYAVYSLDDVLDTLMRPKLKAYFMGDTSWSYWLHNTRLQWLPFTGNTPTRGWDGSPGFNLHVFLYFDS